MKKKVIILVLIVIAIVVVSQIKEARPTVTAVKAVFSRPSLIDKKGDSIASRVKVPEGFTRAVYAEGSFQHFIQNYPLKKFGAKVINYDGNEYFYQAGHFGILELSVPKNGLQQCADALIRLRAEYLWKQNRKEEIGFEFTSGHYCSWKYYAEGYRPKVKGSKVSFHKKASKDHSKTNFYKYLNLIYTYSGTLSLYNELTKITVSKDLQVGDMLVYPGTPGHIVMIVDKAIDGRGNQRFILAQGNTPAQSVHLLKNPNDSQFNPWYDLQMNAYIEVPGYYFNNSKFIRFKK
jgi:hypothetical protein